MGSPHGRYAQDLAGGRDARATLGSTVLKHRGHSCALGGASDRSSRVARADEVAYLLSRFEDFEDASTAAVTGPAAVIAPMGLMHKLPVLQAEQAIAWISRKISRGQPPFRLAALAKNADKPLGDDGAQGRLKQKILNAEVEKAGHGRCCRLGVQRGEDQMAGQRGMNGDVGGLG